MSHEYHLEKRAQNKKKKEIIEVLFQHGVFELGHPSKQGLRGTGLNFVKRTRCGTVLVVL